MKQYKKPTIEVFEIRANKNIAGDYDGWEGTPVTRYDLATGATSGSVISATV